VAIAMRGRDLAALLVLLLAACAPLGAGGKRAERPQVDAADPVTRGQQLFAAEPCARCHRLDGVAGAAGTVGPDLSHVAIAAAQRRPGMSAEVYLRESIVAPDAFTVPGYPRAVMPTLALDEQQVSDLVAFLLTRQ
jgi:mono/diheme cytochrome c family protein